MIWVGEGMEEVVEPRFEGMGDGYLLGRDEVMQSSLDRD